MGSIETISPLDGRYYDKVNELNNFFSELAFIKYRVKIEINYIIALNNLNIMPRMFTEEEKTFLYRLANISEQDVTLIKTLETNGFENIKATNHDVKAVEYFIKLKVRDTSLAPYKEWVHFGLTSEDVNNIAYALMMTESLQKAIIPKLQELILFIENVAVQYKHITMLARTHGQPASPTTLGKEFLVFSTRLKRQLMYLEQHKITAKLNGATGNYNAHVVAFPQVDWLGFSKDFIAQYHLEPNFVTTQVEPKDSYAELFDCLRRINVILLDFCQDVWRYISDEWITQKKIEGEIGSSTMPHKINPIDVENAEGNLGLANTLFEFFSRKLPVSRLQRDLSDSTVLRNIGVSFGYCLVAYDSLLKGLSKIDVNKEQIIKALQEHPEVIAEGIQTILRREGLLNAYEQLKELTRGKKITLQEMFQFIETLDCSLRVKEELKKINPQNYTGLAGRI